MITIDIIACRTCGGQYYAGQQNLVLRPGNERQEPDEIYLLMKRVPKCAACKRMEDRSFGGPKKIFE